MTPHNLCCCREPSVFCFSFTFPRFTDDDSLTCNRDGAVLLADCAANGCPASRVMCPLSANLRFKYQPRLLKKTPSPVSRCYQNEKRKPQIWFHLISSTNTPRREEQETPSLLSFNPRLLAAACCAVSRSPPLCCLPLVNASSQVPVQLERFAQHFAPAAFIRQNVVL